MFLLIFLFKKSIIFLIVINSVVTSFSSPRASLTPYSCLDSSSHCNRALRIALIISEIALVSLSLYAFIFAPGMSATIKYTLISVTSLVFLIDVLMAINCKVNAHTSTPKVLNKTQNPTNQDLIGHVRNSLGVQHKNIKPQGVLYKIKNASSETIGYLFGSIHLWDLHWEGLRDEVNEKLNKTTDVYFEIDMKTLPSPLISVDSEVWDLAQSKNLHFLETVSEQTAVLNPYLQLVKDNADKFANISEYIQAWQTGDETKFESLMQKEHDLLVSINQAHIFHAGFIDRNKTWFNQHFSPQLLSASKANKFFICVGVSHHFDVESDGGVLPGLKTLFHQEGYHLVKV